MHLDEGDGSRAARRRLRSPRPIEQGRPPDRPGGKKDFRSGRAAANFVPASTGAAEPYHHLPFFYLDLFELGYEAVGLLDASLETVADWKDLGRESVVYYLREGQVRGMLLWNVWG
jgi:hypothetical protein